MTSLCTSRQRARAVTLIELLIVVAIVALLASAGATLIGGALRADRLIQIDATLGEELAALESALARDLAPGATARIDGAELIVAKDGSDAAAPPVRYRLDDGTLYRRMGERDQPLARHVFSFEPTRTDEGLLRVRLGLLDRFGGTVRDRSGDWLFAVEVES